jgi:putative inorganic carbon (HCO3(-)) transporter
VAVDAARLPVHLAGADRTLAPGPLTWLTASLVAGTLIAAAAVTGTGELFWAAAGCTLLATTFTVRPDVGLMILVLARPSLDLWADRSLATVAGLRVNVASLTAVTLILVGGAYMAERWGIVRRSPVIVPFFLFVTIAAVSIVVGPSGGAVYEWLRLLSLFVLYGVCYVVIRTLGNARRFALVVLASAAVPVGVGLYQTMEGGAHVIAEFGRATGTFLHPVPFGIFLGLLISFATPLLFSRSALPLAFKLAAPLALVALVGTYTRTAWIGALVGLLLVGVQRHRSLLLLAPVTVALIAFAVPSTVTRSSDVSDDPSSLGGAGSSIDARFTQWDVNLPKIQRNPVVGQGLKAIAENQGALVHNDYLRAAVETGIFGFAVYLWLMLATLRGSYATMRQALQRTDRISYAIALGSLAAGLAFVIMSATSNLMTQVVVAGSFWCIAAIGHAAGPPLRQVGR